MAGCKSPAEGGELSGAEPADSGRFAFFSLNNHTFVDYATQGYVIVVGLLILFFYHDSAVRRHLLLIAHAACLLATQALIRAHACRPHNPVLRFFRHFYPILLYTGFYRETGELNRMFVAGYVDDFVVRLEERLFGCQPSILFMKKLPYLLVSEIFYISYFSYYVMIAGTAIALYVRNKRHFWHYVSIVSFVFYVCYLIYIFLPVVGPRLFYEPAPGFPQEQFPFYPLPYPAAIQVGPFFQIMKLIYDHLEAIGAAFPSSHVAIAICTLTFSWRFIPKIRIIHLVFVALLCVSTVYCRYHYIVDVVAGVLTAGLVVPLGEFFFRKFSRPR